MRRLTVIRGGTVYDPANQLDGVQQDVWIEDQQIVAPPAEPQPQPVRVIDASGLIVMPGGVDMHCHIAGPKVNAGRLLRPDDRRKAAAVSRTEHTRSGTMGSVPSTFATGYRYAGLGYTTAIDAAVSPLTARQVHAEFADTPCLDKGFLAVLGNHRFVLEAVREKRQQHLTNFVGWLLNAVKGYGVKVVNPGGVEVWKQRAGGNVQGLDEVVPTHGITPRQILCGLAQAVDDLQLPHALHIHCNNLGIPGNWTTTLASMQALEGRRGHFTHVQFHSYGGGDEDENTFNSKTLPLAEYINEHPELTVDVGQVLFGDTTSMTGDGPLGYYLHKLNGGRWYSHDVELEGACGVSPIKYKRKNLVHAIQWAAGLEWFLLVRNPWQVALSTDHPNGGSFLAYPQIIRLLMDKAYRWDFLQTLPPKIRQRTILSDLDRQYTLSEISIITRAAPARILGLPHKGHLAPGADADITIYSPHADLEFMFQLPRYVLKAGTLLIDDYRPLPPPPGLTLFSTPSYDLDFHSHLSSWFDLHSTVTFQHYPVDDDCLQPQGSPNQNS